MLLLLIEKQATFIACSFLCIIFRCQKILFDKPFGAVAEQEGRLPCSELCHQEFFALDFGKRDLVAQKGVAPQILFLLEKAVFEVGRDAQFVTDDKNANVVIFEFFIACIVAFGYNAGFLQTVTLA